MKATDFREWLEKISQLNRRQKEQAKHYLSEAKPQAVVVKYLEDSFEPSCPVCQADRPHRWGHQAGLQRFRCCLCKHTFTAISGTPLARLRHKEQWLNYSAALIEGLTVRASGRQCGIDKNTSFRWRHRFLTLPAATKANHLQGIIEADETFFPSSCKGQRHLNRPPRKRGKQIHVRGTGKDQVPVLVVRDRSGATADSILNVLDKKTIELSLELSLRTVLAKDVIFCSNAVACRSVAYSFGIAHRWTPGRSRTREN